MKIYSPNYGFLISNISHLDRNNLRSHKSKKEKRKKKKGLFNWIYIQRQPSILETVAYRGE